MKRFKNDDFDIRTNYAIVINPSASLGLARPRPLVVQQIDPMIKRQITGRQWFFDFGRAAFGTVVLSGSVWKSTRITVHLGEKLNVAGHIDRKPPGCIRYRAISSVMECGSHHLRVEIPSDARNTSPGAIRMPQELFEVMPFRYAEIEVDGDVADLTIVQLAVMYPFDDAAATFRCDDQDLNAVWELCKYTIQATTFCGVYVDGDRERIPYEGDAYINQLCHYGVDAEYELARHSFEYLLFNPTWPTEWVLHFLPMAWADYQYTGRADLLEAYYNVLISKALLPLAREDGLISTETGLVTPALVAELFIDHPHPLKDLIDWPPGSFTAGGRGERDGYDMVAVKTVINSFHAWNLELLEKIATVVGRGDDAVSFGKRFRQVQTNIHRSFVHPMRGIFVDGEGSDHCSLHANMIPAALGQIPAGREADVLKFIQIRGMACSVYGAQYLLEACYQLGAEDYALDLMTADHDRGWLNMLRVGSTMTLEAWDLRYKNNLDWNHAWGAVPANIIPRFLVGVTPGKPGFSEARIAPRPGRLREIEARVPTRFGPISMDLDSASGGKRWLRIETPVPARLDLSRMLDGGAVSTLSTGRHEIALDV